MGITPVSIGYLNQSPVAVANGQKLSVAIATTGMSLVGIITPAALTSTALTFLVCDTIDGTYVPLKTSTSGTALSYTVAPAGYYAIDPKDFFGVKFLKLQFGTNEAADRSVICSLKGI